MTKNEELICEYCNMGIKEKDYKCPYCGANCTNVIKKYQQKEQEKRKEESAQKSKNLKRVSRIFIIVTLIPFLSFIAIIGLMAFINYNFFKENNTVEKNDYTQEFNNFFDLFDTNDEGENISVGYNEVAQTNKFNVILDSYELYEYKSDIFPEQFNTKDGYQKIAFHFDITNNTNRSLYYDDDIKITLNADGYKVSESDLEVMMHCKTIQGQDKYPEISDSSISSGDKSQGYVGYLVPKNAKILKFKVRDNITIIMENPVYDDN